MSEPERLSVAANGVNLNVYRLGPELGEAGPPVVMLHGMRDVGLSLLPVAEAVAATHPVFLLDLRGHGDSDKPGGYAMVQLVYDLHVVMSELVDEDAKALIRQFGERTGSPPRPGKERGKLKS